MRFDAENELSNAQAFTTTAVSTNSYEKQTAAQDLSIGRRMAIMAIVTTAAGAGSTWNFRAVQADNTALSTNKEVLASVQKAAADLGKGAIVEIPFPAGSMSRKHIGLEMVPESGGTETISLSAYLVPQDEIPHYKSFPKVVDAEV